MVYVIIRKAKTSDKNMVLEFCKTTFSWGDYIVDVWDYWIREGNLLVLIENNNPVAICHSSFFDKQVWIEGIRVNENFRKKGFAKRLVLKSESIAKNKNCVISKMLIETNNKKSLNLADYLNYKKEETWNFYSLIPKKSYKKPKVTVAINNTNIINFLLTNSTSYVKSWRWIPLTKTNIDSLINEQRILYTIYDDKINALVIFTESEYFEKTLMLTLISDSVNGSNEIITYFQNYAIDKNIKRIQILTKIKTLPKIENLDKKFSFYLMKKEI
ncbi:MAG: GNAT family N-acetyltransferase [Thaumarchaeota archaeon]|nr:GNAT family N-acetyltransferase [Nitrososphaerota archaeon]